METKLKGDVFTVASEGIYTVNIPGIFTVNTNVSYRNGYPEGVQDFRNATVEECVDHLEQAIKVCPELAEALKLMNSKLYKALK
jgi:hypothetical protein